MSPDFEVMYWQTRSSESAPGRGTASGHRRNGDVPAVDHLPPGVTRSAMSRAGVSATRGPAASRGQTVLANVRNGGRLRLIASRRDDDEYMLSKFVKLDSTIHVLVYTVFFSMGVTTGDVSE